MKNEKKEQKKLFSVRLNLETIKRLEEVSRDRKKDNLKDWSIQWIVENALIKFLK